MIPPPGTIPRRTGARVTLQTRPTQESTREIDDAIGRMTLQSTAHLRSNQEIGDAIGLLTVQQTPSPQPEEEIGGLIGLTTRLEQRTPTTLPLIPRHLPVPRYPSLPPRWFEGLRLL
jgi:hypothetical protein